MPINRMLLVDASPALDTALRHAFPHLEGEGAIVRLGRGEAVQQVAALRPDVVLLAGAADPATVAALEAPRPHTFIPVLRAGALDLELDPAALARTVREEFAEARLEAQLARLEELGGTPFVQEMIELFVGTTPQRLRAAREGLAAGNLETVERAVHSLKSSAGNLGADRVQEIASTMEGLAAARQADSLPELLQELENAFAWARMRFARLQQNA